MGESWSAIAFDSSQSIAIQLSDHTVVRAKLWLNSVAYHQQIADTYGYFQRCYS